MVAMPVHSLPAPRVPATFRPEVRIAISLRLSRSDDASTSLDVQRRACRDSIRAAGFDPATAVEFLDDGVSGATPLADREGMSQLMAYQPTHVWAWKIDRYSRSVREFLALVEWAESTSRVILATADGSLNTATPGGRLVALILVALAEWERQMMTDRILAAHAERREQGRWGSGKAPFPYKVVREHEKAPAYLDADSSMVPLVVKAIGELLAGGNLVSSSEPLPIGRQQWRNLLRSVVLRGWRSFNGELIVQEDGVTPVQFAPPVLDAVTYARVQQRLAELAVGERAERTASPFLAGMVWCAMGEDPSVPCRMSGGLTPRKKPLYKCQNGHGAIMAHLLEPQVQAEFLERFGAEPVMEPTYSGGLDHTGQLADLEASQVRLLQAVSLASGPSVQILVDKLAEIQAAHARLTAEHDPEVRVTLTATDTLLYEAWEATGDDTRAALLAEKGCRVVVRRPAKDGGGRVSVSWTAPTAA